MRLAWWLPRRHRPRRRRAPTGQRPRTWPGPAQAAVLTRGPTCQLQWEGEGRKRVGNKSVVMTFLSLWFLTGDWLYNNRVKSILLSVNFSIQWNDGTWDWTVGKSEWGQTKNHSVCLIKRQHGKSTENCNCSRIMEKTKIETKIAFVS